MNSTVTIESTIASGSWAPPRTVSGSTLLGHRGGRVWACTPWVTSECWMQPRGASEILQSLSSQGNKKAESGYAHMVVSSCPGYWCAKWKANVESFPQNAISHFKKGTVHHRKHVAPCNDLGHLARYTRVAAASIMEEWNRYPRIQEMQGCKAWWASLLCPLLCSSFPGTIKEICANNCQSNVQAIPALVFFSTLH